MSALLPESLEHHAERLKQVSLRDLFAADPTRDFLIREAAGIHMDASRQLLDAPAFAELMSLEPIVAQARVRLFSGGIVNETEQRPALHPFLRVSRDAPPERMDSELLAQISQQRQRLSAFAAGAEQHWKYVVNLGIGGSDLGARMLCEALPPRPGAPEVRFVSSVDPDELDAVLHGCVAASTLFIVASKTFTTMETRANFQAARNWLEDAGVPSGQCMDHFVAITAAPGLAAEAGFLQDQVFPLWDWVGGRYSVWSSVGLPVVLHAGWETFSEFLDGARHMDEHFVQAAAEENAPLMLALLMVWNHSCLGAASRAVLPYNYRLRTLPRYLQQLQMESLGKRACADGNLREIAAPVVWGGPANDGAHAFFQLLHQGAQSVPIDAIVARADISDERQRLLLAQCLAQLDLLAAGRSAEEVDVVETEAIHRMHPGNRASTLFVLDDLKPSRLGALLALFEHATFAAAALWQINAFDQFGVEYGKRLTEQVSGALSDAEGDVPGHTLGSWFARFRG